MLFLFMYKLLSLIVQPLGASRLYSRALTAHRAADILAAVEGFRIMHFQVALFKRCLCPIHIKIELLYLIFFFC